jgi:tripeptide aminopeptidase
VLDRRDLGPVELRVTFAGVSAHAGTAKGRLVNALKLAARFVAALPPDRLSPETTDGPDGFVHPNTVSGGVAATTVGVLVRDFDAEALERHVALIERTAAATVDGVAHARVAVEREDQYRNMRETLNRHPDVTDAAMEAARRVGLTPRLTRVRGGTDGSHLCALGLPTPNLFTGGNDFHSTTEWISVQDMAISAAALVELARLWAEPGCRSSSSSSP